VEARLDKAVSELDRAIRDLRGYIFGLRPGLLADRQLGQAISSLAQDLEEKSGITTVVEIEPEVAEELTSRAGDVIQLVREALSNVARHSSARTCRVALKRESDTALLVIDDDGHGFDPAAVPGGQGLRNLRDRVALLGGELSIKSSLGDGTAIAVRIPRRPPAEVP
jgi:signal transduction histidine kinase